ncbi:MAG: type IIL restriction-modification enzyme MmeI [Sciscionella sp.]
MNAGNVIRQSVKSQPWPSKSAVLEYCAVWTSGVSLDQRSIRIADGAAVASITSSLDPGSRATGQPERLAKNLGMVFNGQYIMGIGFTAPVEFAKGLIQSDPRNSEVLFPYLSGQDVNSRADSSASRWVINFHDWSEARASTYPECFNHVNLEVKPDRLRQKDEYGKRYWWQFFRRRPELQKAAHGLKQVIVMTLHTKTVMPVVVSTGQVFSHALGVFATDDTAMLALLSSAPHYWWAKSRGSSMKTDLRYTPSDVFETFPLPELTGEMCELGDRLDTFRRVHSRVRLSWAVAS